MTELKAPISGAPFSPPIIIMEHTQITFEWTVNGLANLFDSSAGPSKSKLYKSPRFGPEGQWFVFHPDYLQGSTNNGA
jgi:hypothetical protein